MGRCSKKTQLCVSNQIISMYAIYSHKVTAKAECRKFLLSYYERDGNVSI